MGLLRRVKENPRKQKNKTGLKVNDARGAEVSLVSIPCNATPFIAGGSEYVRSTHL